MKEKFASAYAKHCLSVWESDGCSMLRRGIVRDGATGYDAREGLRCESFGYSRSRRIGVPQDCIRHQSPFRNVGDSGVVYNHDDVVDGRALKEGDVVVYKVEFVSGSANPKSGIRVARRVTLIVGVSKYEGDPMPNCN